MHNIIIDGHGNGRQFRVNELEEDVKFLRGCIVELDMALEDVEYEEWLHNPECDPVPEDEDPFIVIN